MASPFTQPPNLTEINLTFPSSTLITKAFDYAKQHCDEGISNHAIRAAYWALIMAKKLPEFENVDLEVVVVSCILHDMGWASTQSLLSPGKRFEVDSANITRDFINSYNNHRQVTDSRSDSWDTAKIQRAWDAIALHATPSIARYGAAEVALTHLGVRADFMGPNMTAGSGESELITIQEYHAVMKRFPRAGFNREGFKKIMCWLCHTKPETTYDNWVGGFGTKFGTDGDGGGREEYRREWEKNQAAELLLPALDSLETLDREGYQ